MKKGLFLLTLVLMFGTMSIGEASMIEKGKKVKFDYTLKVDGEVVDTSDGKEPLEYEHGSGSIIPGLESQMEGLKVGDEKHVVVGPEDGYGVVDQRAFVEFPKTVLAEDIEPQVGMVLQVPTKTGQALPGMISEIRDETLVLNFNHPLAGKELNFDIKVVSID